VTGAFKNGFFMENRSKTNLLVRQTASDHAVVGFPSTFAVGGNSPQKSPTKLCFIFAAKSLMINQQRAAGAFRNGFLMKNRS